MKDFYLHQNNIIIEVDETEYLDLRSRSFTGEYSKARKFKLETKNKSWSVN